MYQHHIQSTLPSCLRNTAPDAEDMQEALNNRANKSKANHDRTAGPERAPFYAGQDVSVWDPQRCLWVPAKIIHRTADQLTRSRHRLVLSIHVLETTSRLIILQLTTHLRSWSHQPLQLCCTQPHQLLYLQHLLLQTSHLYHCWSHPLLQQHHQSSLRHLSLLSPHQQHLHPHLCSDDQSEPLYHHSAWSQRRSSLLTNCCYWPGVPTDYDSAPLTWRQPWWCVVPAHRPSLMMWLSHRKTTMTMCCASPQTIRDDVTVPTVVAFRFSISVRVATLLPSRPFPCKQNFSILIKLVRGMLYYTADDFVCVLPSAVPEGGNKSH